MCGESQCSQVTTEETCSLQQVPETVSFVSSTFVAVQRVRMKFDLFCVDNLSNFINHYTNQPPWYFRKQEFVYALTHFHQPKRLKWHWLDMHVAKLLTSANRISWETFILLIYSKYKPSIFNIQGVSSDSSQLMAIATRYNTKSQGKSTPLSGTQFHKWSTFQLLSATRQKKRRHSQLLARYNTFGNSVVISAVSLEQTTRYENDIRSSDYACTIWRRQLFLILSGFFTAKNGVRWCPVIKILMKE